MIALYANALKEAFTAPRQSARRILAIPMEDKHLALLFGAAYAVSASLAQITLMLVDFEAASLPPLPIHIVGLSITAIMAFTVAGMAFVVGNKLGGTGSFRDLLRVVLWQFFVTAFLTPLETWAQLQLPIDEATQSIDAANTSPVVIGVYAVVFGVQLYVLANFLAEAHKIEKTSKVVLAILSVVLFLAVLVSLSFTG